MTHFCEVCGTVDTRLKHVRVFLNWEPEDGDQPRMELLDPEERTDEGVVLCSGCICGAAAKAMEEGLIVGDREKA